MAENYYSFGKLPKGAFRLLGGYYRTDPRPPAAKETELIDGRRWRLPLATDAAAGTVVKVLTDDGQVFETHTRSEPWQIGGHTWVVLLYGVTGGYALERVTPGGW